MKLRNLIKNRVSTAIREYDFGAWVEEELDNVNIDYIVEKHIEKKLYEIDIEDIIEDMISDVLEDEFDSNELRSIIEETLEV